MSAVHVGCLNSKECPCQGLRYINDPLFLTVLIDCPGPTVAQLGHIVKRAKQRAKDLENRRVRERTLVVEHLKKYGTDPEQLKTAWSSHAYVGALLCALTKHILSLEHSLNYDDW